MVEGGRLLPVGAEVTCLGELRKRTILPVQQHHISVVDVLRL